MINETNWKTRIIFLEILQINFPCD